MKRYFELKFGNSDMKEYDAVPRRGKVEPDFSFVEKTIPSKAVLNYQNPIYFAGDSKRSKAKEEISHSWTKKVKITASKDKHGNEKENMDMNFASTELLLEKYRKEKDILQAKLNKIETLIMTSNMEDGMIVKNIRDYLGIIVDKIPYDNLKDVHEENKEYEFVQEEIVPDQSKVAFALIEGESI